MTPTHAYRFRCPTEDATQELAAAIARAAWPGMVLSLSGSLGAGKTVFARGFARGLGIQEPITSPSYPIIQEYRGRLELYHMDWYRLGSEDEVMETGAADLLDSGGVSLVEWPDRALELFDAETLRVSISLAGDGARLVELRWEHPGLAGRLGWAGGLPPELAALAD